MSAPTPSPPQQEEQEGQQQQQQKQQKLYDARGDIHAVCANGHLRVANVNHFTTMPLVGESNISTFNLRRLPNCPQHMTLGYSIVSPDANYIATISPGTSENVKRVFVYQRRAGTAAEDHSSWSIGAGNVEQSTVSLKHRFILSGHNSPVQRCAFSPNSRSLASVCHDGSCFVFDLSSRSGGDSSSHVGSSCVGGGPSSVASGSRSGTPVATTFAAGRPNVVSFSENNKTVDSNNDKNGGGGNAAAAAVNDDEDKEKKEASDSGVEEEGAAVMIASPAEKTSEHQQQEENVEAVENQDDEKVGEEAEVEDPEKKNKKEKQPEEVLHRIRLSSHAHRSPLPLFVLKGHTDRALCLAWSPDGKLLATGSRDRSVIVWDAVSSGTAKFILKPPKTVAKHKKHQSSSPSSAAAEEDEQSPPTKAIISVVFTADSKGIIAGTSCGAVMFWSLDGVSDDDDGQKNADAAPKQLVATSTYRNTGTTHVMALSVSADGKLLVIGGTLPQKLSVVDISEFPNTPASCFEDSPVSLPEGPRDFVNCVQFSRTPGCNVFAAGSQDCCTRMFDAITGRLHFTLSHERYVQSVSFSPDGASVISVSESEEKCFPVGRTLLRDHVVKSAHEEDDETSGGDDDDDDDGDDDVQGQQHEEQEAIDSDGVGDDVGNPLEAAAAAAATDQLNRRHSSESKMSLSRRHRQQQQQRRVTNADAADDDTLPTVVNVEFADETDAIVVVTLSDGKVKEYSTGAFSSCSSCCVLM